MNALRYRDFHLCCFEKLSAVRKPQAGADDVENRQRHQIAPAEVHELVIAEAGQRSPHPDVEKEETKNLGDEPEDREQSIDKAILDRAKQVAPGTRPTAEKEQRSHATYRDHVGVLGHEEHRELHR